MTEATLRSTLPLLCLLLACSSPEGRGRPNPAGGTPAGTPTGLSTGLPGGTLTGTTTGTTTTTTPWTTTFDCVNRPQVPFATQEFALVTEEDLSFDASGLLVYQDWTAIMGIDDAGTQTVLATGAPGDPAGLDVVADNKMLIAGPDSGTLRLFDLTTGAGDTLLSNLERPNTVLGGRDGMYYVSELYQGRVRWYDPVANTSGPAITDIGQANGLTLSPDERTLYSGGEDTIWAVTRPPGGDWDPTTKVALHTDPGKQIFALETDVCGWIYYVDYGTGILKRVSEDGLTVEPLADLDNPGWSWSGMSFGSGVGGWYEDRLYLTNRTVVVEVDVGVPGAPGPNISP